MWKNHHDVVEGCCRALQEALSDLEGRVMMEVSKCHDKGVELEGLVKEMRTAQTRIVALPKSPQAPYGLASVRQVPTSPEARQPSCPPVVKRLAGSASVPTIRMSPAALASPVSPPMATSMFYNALSGDRTPPISGSAKYVRTAAATG